jgi:hypothetical protein
MDNRIGQSDVIGANSGDDNFHGDLDDGYEWRV